MRLKNFFCYLVIFLFSFTYFCFFNSKNYVNLDDTIFHTTNILTFSNIISIDNLVPEKIIPIMVNNLGYGINLFYPIFPHLITSYIYKLFSLFNLEFASTMKFVYFMIVFLSGIFMYRYINIVFKNMKQAVVSAIMYQSMPYLFFDIFMRGALNESFVFIYLPLIFLSFYYLFEKEEYNKFYFWFILGYSLLIFTHLVIAVWLTLFLIPIMLVYYKKLFRKKLVFKLIKASIIILLITSNFWGPMLEHYFLNNYYIFNLEYNGINNVEVLNLLYYFYPLAKRNMFSNFFLMFNILPVCLLLICSNIYLLYKGSVKEENKKILIGIIIFLILSLLFGSFKFIWGIVPNILKNIQFGWRLALFIAFGSSVIGGYGIRAFRDKIQIYILLFVICFCGVSNYILSSKLDYVLIENVNYLEDSCCNYKWTYEYLPVNSLNWTAELSNKRDDLGIRALDNTRIINNDVPNMSFEVTYVDDNVIVEFPRIYYLGYELKNEDDDVVPLYQNNYGLLEAVIEEPGIYYLEYKGTIIDRITKVLAFITIIGCIGRIIYLKIKDQY